MMSPECFSVMGKHIRQDRGYYLEEHDGIINRTPIILVKK